MYLEFFCGEHTVQQNGFEHIYSSFNYIQPFSFITRKGIKNKYESWARKNKNGFILKPARDLRLKKRIIWILSV